MPFDPTWLGGVGIHMTPHGFEGVGRAIERHGSRAVAEYDAVVQKYGGLMYDAARDNLTGAVLHVRTGRLAGSWAHRRPEPMVFEALDDVFYGALWEGGFNQRAGYFPVPVGGGDVEWRHTNGGFRYKPWALPAVEMYEDDFRRAVDATTQHLIGGAPW